jgi:hypothetical protein
MLILMLYDFNSVNHPNLMGARRSCGQFYSITCVWNMIAARQTDFIRKMMCGPHMITACYDHNQQVGRPQTTRTHFMVENLRLIIVSRRQHSPHRSFWVPARLDKRGKQRRLLEPTRQTPSSSWHAATRATRNVGTAATVARTTSC